MMPAFVEDRRDRVRWRSQPPDLGLGGVREQRERLLFFPTRWRFIAQDHLSKIHYAEIDSARSDHVFLEPEMLEGVDIERPAFTLFRRNLVREFFPLPA